MGRLAPLLPVFYAAVVALGMWTGDAHPAAPYATAALLGSAWALHMVLGGR